MTADPLEILGRRAADAPEEPFLFFRGPRGTFTWWPWRRCAAAAASTEPPRAPEEGEPWRLLRAAVEGAPPPPDAAAALIARLGAGPGREIALSSGPLDDPYERLLARAAIAGGWALVREPAEPMPAATFVWARPTLLLGTAAGLGRLLEETAAEAPRWRSGPWLARRLSRLRALLVAGDDAGDLEARLERVGARALVLPLGGGRW